jgi:23S rRNA (adenine2503-C2)-methyltransferase
LLEGCKIYTDATKRRVTFEYALVANVNDSPGNAAELSKKLRGLLCHVNLIPVNKTGALDFRPPPKSVIYAFEGILRRSGIETTVRRELGADIGAACGQLRNSLSEAASGGMVL